MMGWEIAIPVVIFVGTSVVGLMCIWSNRSILFPRQAFKDFLRQSWQSLAILVTGVIVIFVARAFGW